MELTAENVNSVFNDCLFNEGEDRTINVKSESVMINAGYHPERLGLHREDIADMLNQLPYKFKMGTGDGASFLEACITSDGVHWGEHRDIDMLLNLGIAVGKVKFLMPRDMWRIFPGGMPYFVIN